MLISKPRIDRELAIIEKKLRVQVNKDVKRMLAELKENIEFSKKKYRDDFDKKLQRNNVEMSNFSTIVLVHVPNEKKLSELESWIESNITNHVLIQEAVGLEYEYVTDDEFDYADDEDVEGTNAEDDPTEKVDRYENAYGKRETYSYPTYEFAFVEPADAIRFKLSCC